MIPFAPFSANGPAWQLYQILLMLEQMVGTLAGMGTSSVARTPQILSHTSAGSTPIGSKGITYVMSQDYMGTVMGTPFSGLNGISFRIPVPANDYLVEVPFTVDAGTLTTIDVR